MQKFGETLRKIYNQLASAMPFNSGFLCIISFLELIESPASMVMEIFDLFKIQTYRIRVLRIRNASGFSKEKLLLPESIQQTYK
jgi:hypothetical protein